MRQMTGTMLLLSSAVVMAAPWAHAEEKTIQLTEAEQQEIKTANEKLLGLTLRFLHDSWPLEIMFPGEVQEEFHSILQCHQMLEQFRQTGNLLLQTPDRTTPLHLCIALGLNRLAVRMVETGAPVNAQSIFMHDGTKEPGDTPLTWACLSGLYMNSTAEERLPLVHALLKHGADPDQPGPWGVTPFMYSAALNDSDPGQEKIALALLDAGSPDLKRRMNAQARGVGFLSLSPAIYERLIKAGCDVNERFFESKPCQETFRTGVPFPVLVPVSLHRAADGRRVIIGRQLLQPEKTDSFLNGFLMLNQVIPGRNSSNTLRGNGKNFRQCGTGCLPVRPRLKYGNQQNHRIPAIVSGSRLGKGSRIFRRPRPYLPHPCILFFRGRRRRDYGQLPQPRLQTGSVEHSGTQQGAGT